MQDTELERAAGPQPRALWPRRTVVIAVVGLALCASALRFTGLARESFWCDEEFSRQWMLHSSSMLGAVKEAALEDLHPPLYTVGLYCWSRLAGLSDAALRAFPATIGVATILASYLLLRLILGDVWALGFAGLLCVSPWHIAYSQEVRQAALLIFEGIVTFALLALYCEQRRPWALWSLVGVALAGLYTHEYYPLMLPGVGLVLAAVAVKHPEERVRVLLAGIAVVALYLPWLFVLPLKIHQAEASWLPGMPPSLRSVRMLLDSWCLGARPGITPRRVAEVLALGLFAWGLYTMLRARRRSALVAWLATFLGPLVLALAWTLWHGMWVERSLSYVTALAIVPVAGGFTAKSGWIKAAAVALAVVALGYSIANTHVMVKEDWRGAARLVRDAAAGGQCTVLVTAPWFTGSLAHYGAQVPGVSLVPVQRGIAQQVQPRILKPLFANVLRGARECVVVTSHCSRSARVSLRSVAASSGFVLRRRTGLVGIQVATFERRR